MKNFYRHCTAIVGLCFLSIISSRSIGQPEKFNVDSIKAIVKKLSSDTDKVKTYINTASGMYCEDSTNKLLIAGEAKKLAEEIKWSDGIYYSNRKLAEIYFSCSRNYDKAFQAFEDNVTYAHKNKDTLNEAKAIETIAKAYQKISQYQKALEYYNKVLSTTSNADMTMGVMADMGVVYSIIGDYSHALISYKNSLKLLDSVAGARNARDLMDTLQTAGLHLNIGDIYLATSQPDNAYMYYNKVLDVSNVIKDTYFQIAALTGIGKTFSLKNNYLKSIDFYQIALGKTREINEFKGEVRILNELAGTYMDMYVYPKALLYADTALMLAEDQNYADLLPKLYITLGNIYIKQNNFELAIPSLQKALGISQKNNVLEDEKDSWLSLSSAYKLNGQPKEALEAYVNFITIRDSIHNIQKENEFIKRSLEMEFSAKRRIDSLNQQYVYDRTIGRQKTLTYTSLGGLVLVGLLAFFIYRNYETQKKYNELLSKEKKGHLAHIEAQSNVLSDIAHIQAHHVRGPVSTILGLVQLFNYDDPADPVNKEVIDGLGVVTQKLDNVVKEVIQKENNLRYGKSDDDPYPGSGA